MIREYGSATEYSNTDRPQRVLDFIRDVQAVCDKHGLSIAHQQTDGEFLIERPNEANAIHFGNAIYIDWDKSL
jgi:hypothetical protein